MSKKISKPKTKSNNQQRTTQSQDFFQNLLDSNCYYPSPTGSSSNPQPQIPIVNPYSLPQDNPNSQMYMEWYLQSQQQNRPPMGFAHFQTPTQPQPQPPTPFQVPSEEVQEIHPDEADPKGKKPRAKKIPWTEAESRILAECFVLVSENPNIGNSQARESFWGTVRKEYNARVHEPRRADQISGKWSKMARKVKVFIACYNKIEEHWQSGAGDENILINARRAYKQQMSRSFVYEESWLVLKDCAKFLEWEGVMAQPKRKTPVDEEFLQPDPVNLDDDTPTDVPNPTDFDSLFREDPIRRPSGRAKSQKSSASSDAASRVSSDDARQKLVESAEATQRTMEKLYEESQRRTEYERTRTMFKGLAVLQQPVPDNLPPDEYRMIMRARERIKKKYAKELQGSDEDED